ncbi:MAG: HAD-IA family hydrolase [Gammaproteobacteria bacterium]|nr:HAD-IA family hydrolase [Gammaproteobacteria bacterium]MBU1653996.1 HAD-IA family hydrolase [Gammaproteobacteria bacterium]MBU1960452.1 HAD-IA family hydrolase [Gammaproteobacteria bacterium]
MNYKLLVFDWDGTLMDSEAKIVACMQAAFVDLGMAVPSRDAVRDIIGLGLRESIQTLYPGAGDGLVDDLFQGYRHHFLGANDTPSQLFPDVEKTLEQLDRAGYLLTVATGKGRRGLDRVLDETGLGRFFIATRCADETFSKPHPEMLNQLIDLAGVEASEALMIGDTEYDLQMAVNAGADALAVSYGVHEVERLLSHGPIGCLDAIGELPDYLASLASQPLRFAG